MLTSHDLPGNASLLGPLGELMRTHGACLRLRLTPSKAEENKGAPLFWSWGGGGGEAKPTRSNDINSGSRKVLRTPGRRPQHAYIVLAIVLYYACLAAKYLGMSVATN